jgi:hypothetical protein
VDLAFVQPYCQNNQLLQVHIDVQLKNYLLLLLL